MVETTQVEVDGVAETFPVAEALAVYLIHWIFELTPLLRAFVTPRTTALMAPKCCLDM